MLEPAPLSGLGQCASDKLRARDIDTHKHMHTYNLFLFVQSWIFISSIL